MSIAITTVDDIIAKYDHKLSIKELIAELSYAIDDIYIDRFWENIKDKKWIYIDKQILEWIGYDSIINDYKPKQRYLELLENFNNGTDYKHINSAEFKEHYQYIKTQLTNNDINLHNKAKHLLVSPRCFKKTLMMIQTSKANDVREYYLNLEEIYNMYLEYDAAYNENVMQKMQQTIDEKDQEIEKIKKASNPFKSIVINKNTLKRNQFIYVASSQMYSKKNIFKVGMTTSFKDRIRGYQTGRCEEDKFYYLYVMSCVSARELEQLIFTRLESFKYLDSNGVHKKELYEIHYKLLIQILKEFELFEQNSTKTINNHLLKYYEEYQTMPLIDLEKLAITDIQLYIDEKCDSEFKYEPTTLLDLSTTTLTTESINEDLKQYNLKLISPYTGRCESEHEFQCLSIFEHKIKVAFLYMNMNKHKGCVYCRKSKILDQIPIYKYTDKSYTYVKTYNTFEELSLSEPKLNHQLLRNIIREERWLTPHHGYIYSILSPYNDKLDLNKPIDQKESIIIETLEIDFNQMKDRIMTSKLIYILGIDHKTKIVYYGSSMTAIAAKLINHKTNKLINRKSISTHLNTKKEYGGYQWLSSDVLEYKDYKIVDSDTISPLDNLY